MFVLASISNSLPSFLHSFLFSSFLPPFLPKQDIVAAAAATDNTNNSLSNASFAMFSFRHERHSVFIDVVSWTTWPSIINRLEYQTCCNQSTQFIPNEKQINAASRSTASSAAQHSATCNCISSTAQLIICCI